MTRERLVFVMVGEGELRRLVEAYTALSPDIHNEDSRRRALETLGDFLTTRHYSLSAGIGDPTPPSATDGRRRR